MPHDDPDPSDPQMRIGVLLPGGPETTRDMAWAFAEEFARMGFGEQEILRLFHDPFYAAAHAAHRILGAAEIAAIARECTAAWGGARAADTEAAEDRDIPAPLRGGGLGGGR